MQNFKINKYDACKILGITGDINPEIVKQAYKRACMKYHPDRNPAGLEMMKSVNLAYESLKNLDEKIDIKESVINYGDELNAAIVTVLNLGLTVEICGSWLWVSGDTRTHKDTLKQAGFNWAPKKQMWSFHPSDYRSWSRGRASMDQIRERYGSKTIRPGTRQQLPAA